MSSIVSVEVRGEDRSYPIEIGYDGLAGAGDLVRRVLPSPAVRIALISDRKVFRLYGERVVRSLSAEGLQVSKHVIPGGERSKSFRVVERLLAELSAERLTRTDAVVGLGGGVVGDISGFTASIYLRGIPFVLFPTTLLAMIDSSVGGKTAVNSSFGKNLIGTFYQPSGVLADPSVLATLDRREITAGICEAMKQGAIGGRGLFESTESTIDILRGRTSFLEAEYGRGVERLIADHVRFKADIVAGDAREASGRADARSRKILNFGHTLAHALERATNYRYFRHGEAVGYGVKFAVILSRDLGMLDPITAGTICDSIDRAGNLPSLEKIDREAVFAAFAQDKKVVGGSLQWILLREIGRPEFVGHENIPEELLRSAYDELMRP